MDEWDVVAEGPAQPAPKKPALRPLAESEWDIVDSPADFSNVVAPAAVSMEAALAAPGKAAVPIPERSWRELGTDMVTQAVTGATEGITALADAPRRGINYLTDNLGRVPNESGILEQGGIAADMLRTLNGARESLRIEQPAAQAAWEAETDARVAAARAGGNEQLAPLSGKAKAQTQLLNDTDGFVDTAAAVLSNPSMLPVEAAKMMGQMMPGMAALPLGGAATLGAQGAMAGSMTAGQVSDAITKPEADLLVQLQPDIAAARANVPQLAEADDATILKYIADTRATDAFGPSMLINSILPKLIPGGMAMERALGANVAGLTGSRAANAVTGLLGEAATEGLQGGADQVVQNVQTERPTLEGVGKQAVLESLLAAGPGAFAGALDSGVQPGVQTPGQYSAGATDAGVSRGNAENQEGSGQEDGEGWQVAGAERRAGEAQADQQSEVATPSIADTLRPREPEAVSIPEGMTLDQARENYRAAQTDEERAAAAATIGTIQQAVAPVVDTAPAPAAEVGAAAGADAAADAVQPDADARWRRPAGGAGAVPATDAADTAPGAGAAADGSAVPGAEGSVAGEPVALRQSTPASADLLDTAAARSAVAESLGTANKDVNVHANVSQVPAEVRSRVGLDNAENANVEGFYDPKTGQVHIMADNLDTSGGMSKADRAVWVAHHERSGHAGLRGLALEAAGGDRRASNNEFRVTMERARQNPTVKAVADRIAADYAAQDVKIDDVRTADEAIAELAAATRTGNFDAIEQRYGVKVPQAQRAGIKAYIQRLVQQVRAMLPGGGKGFSDADVHKLIEDSWRYVKSGKATVASDTDTVAQRAYHGTPQKGIEKFSLSKIGTGEGNQAYGWGIYQAGNRTVADMYRKGLSAVGRSPGGTLADTLIQKTGDRKGAIEMLKHMRSGDLRAGMRISGRTWQNEDAMRREIDGAEKFIRADNNRGQLYQTEVPEDNELLDYDAPLSKQPLAIRDAVKSAFNYVAKKRPPPEYATGREAYQLLSQELGSDRAASEALGASGIPGLRYADGESRSRIEDRTYNYVLWDESKVGTPEGLIASRTTSGIMRNLTPAEQKKLTDKVAVKVLSVLEQLPSRDETAAIAYAGKAKRGWYAQSAKAISDIFGHEAPQFAGLLAALSPQISVEGNLKNALNVWTAWIDAGRPTEDGAIREVVTDALRRTFGQPLDAWMNNAVRGLQGQPMLSGPKVDSFMKNLLGNVQEVTNDAWMANWANVDQTLFKGGMLKSGKDPGKGSGYLAMNALVRDAAARLTKLTGETWTPAEVQETVWSWAKTLTELTDSAAESRSATDLVNDRAVTDELIGATPDFGSLFNAPEYRKLLEESGYGEQLQQVRAERAAQPVADQGPKAGGKTAPFAAEAQLKHERRAASRVDKRRAADGALKPERARLEKSLGDDSMLDAEEDIPFSRKQVVDPYGEDKGADLAGLPSRVRVGDKVVAFHGYEPAQSIAAKYAKRHGTELPKTYAQVDEKRAKRIADAYEKMAHEPQDPKVKAAYAAMIKETLQQYDDILKTGLKVEFIDGEDPYKDGPREAILDVVNNNHLWVYPTSEGFGSSEFDADDNPLLAETDHKISGKTALANDIFRVVHDYFGHIANGVGFRADGEENAWREHSAMYSPAARRAMTTETRGQNSWVNYGPNGKANQTASSADTVYADQKTGLLPEWVSTEGAADAYAGTPDQLMGFGKGKPKPFEEQGYSHTAYVRATFEDGNSITDAVKGLNATHALARARRNWPTAQVEAVDKSEFDADGPIASRGFSAKKRQPDAVSVDAYHYSREGGLDELDPREAGTGGAGRERARFGTKNFGRNGGTAARTAFYVREPGKPVPRPESQVATQGTNLYRVQLDNLYDLDADPRDLRERNIDATEEAISEAGFDGFVAGKQAGIDSRVAVVFDIPGKIPVEAVGEEVVASRRTPAQARADRQQLLGHLSTRGYGQQGNPQQPAPGGRWLPLKEATDKLRTAMQDKMLPLLRAQQRTGAKDSPGQTSITLDDLQNTYRLETLMHGATADAQRGAELKYVMPLQNLLKGVNMKVETFEGFLLARATAEVNRKVASITNGMQDGAAGITTAEAAAVLNGTGPNPYTGKPMSALELRQAAQAAVFVDGLRKATLDAMVAAGQITPKLRAQLVATYPNYIPMRGNAKVEDWMAKASGTGKGLSGKKAPLKRRLGRGAGNLPENIIGEMAGDMTRANIAAGKAKVNQAFLRFALANPMPDLFTVEPVDLEWKYSESTGEAYLGVKSAADDGERSMIVMDNGQPVRIRFEDEAIRDAILNMGVDDYAGFVKIVGSINRWRSKVLTQWNPAFTPVNMVRDALFGIPAMAVEKGLGVASRATLNYHRAAMAIAQDNLAQTGDSSVPNAQKTWADWVREANETGMKTGMTMVDDVVDLQRKMSIGATTLMQLAQERRPWALAKQAAYRALSPVVDAIDQVNGAYENALRLAVYVELRKQGDSPAKAAEYAKNMTINFNRKGKYGPLVNALFLFYNASVQGTHAVQRVLRDPKIQVMLAGMAGLSAMMAGSMMEDDDDDGVTPWDMVPDYAKRTSLIIPLHAITGKVGDYFALPMPFGFNVVTYSGARLMQWHKQGARENDPSFIADIVKGTSEAFMPIPVSEGYGSLFGDTIGFAMQLAANKDDLGIPIAKEEMNAKYDSPKALNGKPDTPRIYQATAQLLAKLGGGNLEKRIPPVGYLDVAPEQLESVVNFMGGGLTSLGNKSMRWYEQIDAQNLDRDMDKLSAAPILGRFFGTGNEARAVAELYYHERGELARKRDVLQDRAATGDNITTLLGDASKKDAAMEGLTPDLYKTGDKKGQVKKTQGGDVAIKELDGYPSAALKSAEKVVKSYGKMIQKLRDPKITLQQVVELTKGVDKGVDGKFGKQQEVTLTDLGMVPTYQGKAEAPTRVRSRAIKIVQDARAEAQRDFLQNLHYSREKRGNANKTLEIKTGTNEVKITTDGAGSPLVASGVLKEDFGGNARGIGEGVAQGITGSRGKQGDQGGHVIGHRFMKDQGARNLFPQNGNFNTSAYKRLENEYARLIAAGNEVHFTHTMTDMDGDRPGSLTVNYDVFKDGQLVDSETEVFRNESSKK